MQSEKRQQKRNVNTMLFGVKKSEVVGMFTSGNITVYITEKCAIVTSNLATISYPSTSGAYYWLLSILELEKKADKTEEDSTNLEMFKYYMPSLYQWHLSYFDNVDLMMKQNDFHIQYFNEVMEKAINNVGDDEDGEDWLSEQMKLQQNKELYNELQSMKRE